MEKKGSSRKSKWMSAILILAGICFLLYAWSIGQGKTKRMDAKEEVLSFAIYGDADTEKIKKDLTNKIDALVMRELYSKYKIAPTEEEKEKARKEYLDRRGVPDSFRW